MKDLKMHKIARCGLTIILISFLLVTQTDLVLATKRASQNEGVITNNAYKDSDLVTLVIELDTEPMLSQNKKARNAMTKDVLLAEHTEIREAINKKLGSKARSIKVSQYDYTMVMNGFTLVTAYGDIEKIKEISGVKNVFVSEQRALSKPVMSSSSEMVGAPLAWNTAGFKGEGMRVAIIDSGLDLSHEAFQTDPVGASYDEASMTEVFNKTIFASKKANSSITAKDVYHNQKVPYQYDYAENDTNVSSEDIETVSDVAHGTHVAGIIAGYKANEEGVVTFSGIAPEAQLFIMKVFTDQGVGAFDHHVIAALEDASNLNVDAINLSIAAVAGFGTSENATFSDIFQRISDVGIDVMCGAGNNFDSAYQNGTGLDLNNTSDPDRGVLGSPGSFYPNNAVASIENMKTFTPTFQHGERYIGHIEVDLPMNSLIEPGQSSAEFSYVYLPGSGSKEEFDLIDVKDKIVLLQRDGGAFSDKIKNATEAGALAVIIFDNVEGYRVKIEAPDITIPASFITMVDGDYLKKAQDKKITVLANEQVLENEHGGFMSNFSSLGTTPDLKLKPEITAPGGEIFSTMPVAMGSYGTKRGTSMATPHITGMSVLTKQYIKQRFGDRLTATEQKNLINQLLMSTAQPVKQEDGVYDSPRKQGAGLANIYHAVTSDVYLSVSPDETGNVKPKLELGDDPNKTGVYTLSFNVHNMSNYEQTFLINTTTLIDGSSDLDASGKSYILDHAEQLEKGIDVLDNASTIIVPANDVKTLTITLSLTESGKAKLDKFANGDFIEGFVELIPEAGTNHDISLSIPFMGFYGNWAQAPIFEASKWYENSNFYLTYPLEMRVNFGFMEHGAVDTLLLGTNYLAQGMAFNKDVFAISPNGDGKADQIQYIDFGLLRNADEVRYVVEDLNHTIVYSEKKYGMRKSVFDDIENMIYPATSFTNFMVKPFNGKDKDGNLLPDGQYTFIIKATIDYEHTEGNVRDTYQVPIKIDTKKPSSTDVKLIQEQDKQYLVGTISDENTLMSVGIRTTENELIDIANFNDGRSSYTFQFDVSEYKNQTLTLFGIDYAYNESLIVVHPEVSEDDTLVNSILHSQLMKAEAIDLTKVLTSVKDKIETAKKEAEVIYRKNTASIQEKIDAWFHLVNAMQYVEFRANEETLENLIKECKLIQVENYVEGVDAFSQALHEATLLLEQAPSTQSAIQDAYTILDTRRLQLVKQDAYDKRTLELMMAKIKTQVEDGSLYKQDTYMETYLTALEKANKHLDYENVTQKELAVSLSELTSAYVNLRLLPNAQQTTTLQRYVSRMETMHRLSYTKEQLTLLDGVLSEVHAMLTEFNSKQMGYLEKSIQDATKVMQQVENKTPEDPKTPESDTNHKEEVMNPDTKDTSNATALMLIAVIAGCIALFALIKTKNKD